MNYKFLVLITACSIVACSSLPQVYPVGDSTVPQPQQACSNLFPDGKWQFLHSIEATLPGGNKGFVMGLTVISSSNRSARCVIMTLEGLVVFDAQYDRQIDIKRAISPFDSKEFAAGLLKDIKLIFFEPTGNLIASGLLNNGSTVCRYRNSDRIVDIILHEDHSWEIRQYLYNFTLVRTVHGVFADGRHVAGRTAISKRIELKAHVSQGYALTMNLVEAIPLKN
ncbi:MAG: hypothetical protein KJO34_03030 [Deltaproteobacteria bacterium]|nr:hypothetical protein [Deltaproteobacteria bacterium]